MPLLWFDLIDLQCMFVWFIPTLILCRFAFLKAIPALDTNVRVSPTLTSNDFRMP